MIGAFALVAFVSHFFDLEWRGFLATLVSQCNEYVRPAVAWPLHILVTVPLGWFGWHVEVPLLIRDYLAVGLLLFFSAARRFTCATGSRRKTRGKHWYMVLAPLFYFGLLLAVNDLVLR